ncbi:unnamed protein product [Leptidea sinapis]|uniref:Uncharacterized protein n=1 Tax=Leptidea sinapis TaxID=189913 RepID=A0A5E4Q8H0_9NEOP|nr:unnamed protein product [Leptidea sinapis]
MQGANAVFSLQTEIAIGERCVMAVASGTAVRLCSLPPPAPPTIKRDALEIQKALWDAFAANKAANGYENGGGGGGGASGAGADGRQGHLRPGAGRGRGRDDVWRTRLSPGCAAGLSAERLVSSALSGAAYKLRRLQPAALAPPVIR